MIDLKSMNIEEISEILTRMKEPKFRAGQIFEWMHRGITSFDKMTNIPKSLRDKLRDTCEITCAEIERKQVAADGTIKYLWRLPDDNCVESVFMEYKHGNTICISSQVGCRMGCVFCASTIDGLVRNLTPAELLEQVLRAKEDTGKNISNIVLMGTGEPLDNYDNVLRFLHLVNDKRGLNIGMRHISLSTCGLCDKILKLADENLQITLSVSLHAPDDIIRSKIMPVNRKYNVDTLLDTCKTYFKKTSRRISFEYTMIREVSDTDELAEKLASRLRGFPCHVNLIPLNCVEDRTLKPSTQERIQMFSNILGRSGITVTVRRSLGGDIDAACGQLRRNVSVNEQR